MTPSPDTPTALRASTAGLRGHLVAQAVVDAATRTAMFELLSSHFVGVDRWRRRRPRGEDRRDPAGGRRPRAARVLHDVGLSEHGRGPATHSGLFRRHHRRARVVGRPDACRRVAPERAAATSTAATFTGCCSLRGSGRTGSCRSSTERSTRGSTSRPVPARGRCSTPLPLSASATSTTGLPASSGSCGHTYIAGSLVEVREGPQRDPHVQYFLERNPGFVAGDELVCLTRVHEDNLTPAGRRVVRHLR